MRLGDALGTWKGRAEGAENGSMAGGEHGDTDMNMDGDMRLRRYAAMAFACGEGRR